MNKNIKRIALAATAAAITIGSVTACSAKNQEPFKDGPKLPGHDRTPALLVEMPDGFSNIATKCIGTTGVRVTVAYHGNHMYAGISTILDPRCPTS